MSEQKALNVTYYIVYKPDTQEYFCEEGRYSWTDDLDGAHRYPSLYSVNKVIGTFQRCGVLTKAIRISGTLNIQGIE